MTSLHQTDLLNNVQPSELNLEYILTKFNLISHEPNLSLFRDIILPAYTVLNFMNQPAVDLMTFGDSSRTHMSDWKTIYCMGKMHKPAPQDTSQGEDETESIDTPHPIPKEYWTTKKGRTVYSTEYLSGGMLHASIIDALSMLSKYIKVVQPTAISCLLIADMKTMQNQLTKAQAAEKQLVKFQESHLKSFINELEWADFEKEFTALLAGSSMDWILANNQESSRFDVIVGNFLLKYIEKCDYPAISFGCNSGRSIFNRCKQLFTKEKVQSTRTQWLEEQLRGQKLRGGLDGLTNFMKPMCKILLKAKNVAISEQETKSKFLSHLSDELMSSTGLYNMGQWIRTLSPSCDVFSVIDKIHDAYVRGTPMNKLLAKRKDLGKTKPEKPKPSIINRRVQHKPGEEKNKEKSDRKRHADKPPGNEEPPAKRPVKTKRGKATQRSQPPRDGSDPRAKPVVGEVSKSEDDNAKPFPKRDRKKKSAKRGNSTLRRVIREDEKDEAAPELADSEPSSD